MDNRKLFVSSHAPYWHNGSSIAIKSYNIMLAALPAVLLGIFQYGAPALGVVTFSISCAIIWELIMNVIMRRPISVGDGNAAVIVGAAPPGTGDGGHHMMVVRDRSGKTILGAEVVMFGGVGVAGQAQRVWPAGNELEEVGTIDRVGGGLVQSKVVAQRNVHASHDRVCRRETP